MDLRIKITQQLKKLALKYRKVFSDDQIFEMSELTSETLKFVPLHKIEQLFDLAFRESRYFPDDRKLLEIWHKIKDKGQAKGFYDCWGTWMPEGIFFTWLTRTIPEWIVSRDIEIYIKFKKGDMNENENLEYKNKKWYPVKGRIQKPQYEWDTEDYRFQNKFYQEYEKMREKYLPILGFEYVKSFGLHD